MKKRMMCTILALMLMFIGVVPASAVEANPDMDGEWIFLSDEQVAMLMSNNPTTNMDMTVDVENADMIADIELANARSSTLVNGAVYSITISPVAYAVLNTGEEGFVQLDSISRTIQYTTYYQNAKATLTNSSTLDLMKRLDAVCAAKTDDYSLVGWFLEVKFLFQAPTPISFVWKASETNMSADAFETYTLSLRNQGTSLRATCSYAFPYPPDINPLTDKYEIKIGGLYNFQTMYGQTLTMDVSATCCLNN